MTGIEEPRRDMGALVVSMAGAVAATEDPWEPFQLVDPHGAVVEPVRAFLADLQASGRPASTQRSYALALLRWFRFLWTVEVGWDQATRIEARDFSRWMQIADKPAHEHWRHRGTGVAEAVPEPGPRPVRAANPVTGKPAPGSKYAPATIAHSETVVRSFYEFHREALSGPMVNPFPPARRGPRAHAHHNPLEPFRKERAGLYRPRVPTRAPRAIPDRLFDELFAGLPSNRDRALIAFFVSTGARAAELLGARFGDADPGRQLVTVIRKGTRAIQSLPASPDAFVWLRLYQAQMDGLVPDGPDQPLWWTLRRPFRALSYPAAHRMFQRANALLGANWGLHDLRHTAAYRMSRDPGMPLTDVQWVLGHAQLSTTQIYLNPVPADVIAGVLAFHSRRAAEPAQRRDAAAPGRSYRSQSLEVLFGRGTA